MAIEYNFTLDMDRSKRDNNIAYARIGDVDSITINADLVLNGAAYTPTGANAFFECVTPNGHSVRAAAEKTGSSVSVEVPSVAFQAAGVINVAYFRFESGEADNPTYVESTEPFAIVVREGIGDDVDAGDYIEEWRQLADSLDEIAKGVQQKATQAQTSIAKDTVAVENAKTQAISNIDSSQAAVDAAINQLEEKTQEAVDAAQEALDGTLATDLKNEINRTLKLDVADMVNISDNTSLSSFTAVGSYCCKTASAAATIDDCPIDDSPFNMYVFSSATSGQVMQLVVPVDLQGKQTAEWYVRFGTSSAMDNWSVIGGGMPDIVPVSQGGTGVTTAEAERNRLGLGNTTGALPVANGGTGATDAANARQQLQAASNSYTNSPAVSDTDYVVTSTSASSGTRATFATLWNWIATKIRSVFGFNSSNVLDVEHGGTGFNDFPAMLVDLESTSTASPYQSAPKPGVTGTLPVSRGGTGATDVEGAIEALGLTSLKGNGPYVRSRSGSSLKVWVLSKVVNAGDGTVVVFDNTTFKALTGHTFNQAKDFVFLMNGDESAAGVNSPGTYTTPSYNLSNGGIFVWVIGPDIAPNKKNGPVKLNILVLSTA